MNTIKINNKLYKYEFFWTNSSNKDIIYDYDDKPLKFPIHIESDKSNWEDKDIFINQLKIVENYLYKKKHFIPYKKSNFKNCLLCHKKQVADGLFSFNGIRWENSTRHYMKKHSIKPSDEFVDFIYRFNLEQKTKTMTLQGVKVVKADRQFIKLERNQIMIMDALMQHGAQKIYKDKHNKHTFRYSEHHGLLDFTKNGLESIIISGNTSRVDKNDQNIYLPFNTKDSLKYEYIFHTHPPTPDRLENGFIYEFPSVGDIFHFIGHYNEGVMQGSLIVAPEGLYCIRKNNVNDKNIEVNEDELYIDLNEIIIKCINTSFKKYGKKFTQETFYKVIALDDSFINMINKVLNKYELHVDYYPRVKDSLNRYIIDTVYLPVYTIDIA